MAGMVELITKKRRGGALTQEETAWLVQGVTQGSIPDYQISAWLMAVFFQGMSREETVALPWKWPARETWRTCPPSPG